MKYSKDFIESFKSGSSECFNKVFKDFVDPLYQFCFFRLNSKEDAEDLVEEILTKVYKNMTNFDDSKSSIKTWIYSIARNSLIDFIRSKKDNFELSDSIEDESISIDGITETQLNAESLKQALLQLSDFERELVEMRFISEMSYDEISTLTGKNPGTLRVSLSRTLDKLKHIFADLGIVDSNI